MSPGNMILHTQTQRAFSNVQTTKLEQKLYDLYFNANPSSFQSFITIEENIDAEEVRITTNCIQT